MPLPIQIECYSCFIRQVLATAGKFTSDEKIIRQLLKKVMRRLADLPDSFCAPEFAEFIYADIAAAIDSLDPYAEEKQKYNQMAMDLLPELRERVRTSANSLKTSAQLAVAGNIIDFGVKSGEIDLLESVEKTLENGFRIDDSEDLSKRIREAKIIVYVGDNTGEIVMDRLFVEEIKRNSNAELFFIVRGAAIINDVTREDAMLVGIDQYATILDSGKPIPGLLLNKAPTEVQKIFHQADLVISKGQGNLECLLDEPGEIYFMLKAKCETIARLLGVDLLDSVVSKGVRGR